MVNAESTIRPFTCTPKSTLSTSLCCRTEELHISRRLNAGDIRQVGRTLLVTRIWRIVGRDVIHIQAGRETDARFEIIALYKRSSGIFNVLRDLGHGHARFDHSPRICANLPMDFCRLADVIVVILFDLHGHSFEVSLLLICCPPCVAIIGSGKHRDKSSHAMAGRYILNSLRARRPYSSVKLRKSQVFDVRCEQELACEQSGDILIGIFLSFTFWVVAVRKELAKADCRWIGLLSRLWFWFLLFFLLFFLLLVLASA